MDNINDLDEITRIRVWVVRYDDGVGGITGGR
jgi:hypothetical protein